MNKELTWEEVKALEDMTGGVHAIGADSFRFENAIKMYFRDIKPAQVAARSPARVGGLAFEKCVDLQVYLNRALEQTRLQEAHIGELNEKLNKRRRQVQRRWDMRHQRRANQYQARLYRLLTG